MLSLPLSLWRPRTSLWTTLVSLVLSLVSQIMQLTRFSAATRGFDEDLEPNFCGGFPNPSSSRTPFPLSGAGPILIDSHHASAIVGVLISFDQNATSFADFNQTSSGQGYGFLSPLGSITGTGEVRVFPFLPSSSISVCPSPNLAN